MVMDPSFGNLSNSGKEFSSASGVLEPTFDQYNYPLEWIQFTDPAVELEVLDPQFRPPGATSGVSAAMSSEGDSNSDDNEFLKYISQMLMEEDMEEKPCMFHDPLALQAAEKSLYEAIGERYPDSPDQHPLPVDSPDDNVSGHFSDHISNANKTFKEYSGNDSSSGTLIDHGAVRNSGRTIDDHGSNGGRNLLNGREVVEKETSVLQSTLLDSFDYQSGLTFNSHSALQSSNAYTNNGNGLMDSSVSKLLAQNLFSDSTSLLQFQRGVEEASKFLPKGNMLVLDFDNKPYTREPKEEMPRGLVKVEKKEDDLPTALGKKSHERDDVDLEEERSNKQYALDGDESDLSEMFDKILLCGKKGGCAPCGVDGAPETEVKKKSQSDEQMNGSNGGKNRKKKQGGKKEVVDLRTLLILCAQSVSADDRRTAGELLKQIRQHSSPLGDGSQRLAHCFANALEARLSGTGTQIYTALASKRTSAADMLKAYQVYISVCPFKKLSIGFANHTIFNLAKKASTLHIIDFGILYGFQWPPLIYFLADRPEGPPKLRITGIELPQRGFRPAERVQQTGRRLERYCERFGVPFEYNAIAQKWETIKIEDLKIKNDEVVAVNCVWRFRNLLDETVAIDSPRDAVLKLIKKINPAVFVHSVVNGSYNAPFFVTRFREALFHYSALFDMLDANLPRDHPMRLMFEKEFIGREAMNVVACEGSERVERPETYKQWQVRNMRAGFRQLPLEPDLMKKLRWKLKAVRYHSDFMIDEDGNWMLQGWKGRILYASSCWVPA